MNTTMPKYQVSDVIVDFVFFYSNINYFYTICTDCTTKYRVFQISGVFK